MKAKISVQGLMIVNAIAAVIMMAVACDSNATLQAQPAGTQPTPQVQASETYVAPAIVRKADFGAWRYFAQKMGSDRIQPFGGAQINPGDVFAKVNYNSDSADGVRAYAEANCSQLQKVVEAGGQAEAWITFRSYIAPDDFRAWVKQHNLQNPQSQIRTIDNTKGPAANKYGTIQTGPTSDYPNDPIPDVHIKAMQNINPNAIVAGVYFTRGWVDAKELTAIASDPNVYFIDVTPNLVRMDLAANGVANTDKVDVEVEPVSPMWTMEQTGLDQFK